MNMQKSELHKCRQGISLKLRVTRAKRIQDDTFTLEAVDSKTTVIF